MAVGREFSRNHKIPRLMQSAAPFISEDIIREILLMLPIKSLLRFRCVSKSWCSLISDKDFIKTHLEKSRMNTKFTHHCVIPTSLHPKYNPKTCSLQSLLFEQSAHANIFVYPLISDDINDQVDVVGCCNGLCCLVARGNQLCLWNPSIRKYNKLPDMFDIDTDFVVKNYGFGFDPSNDDYKVLVVLYNKFDYVVKLCSLKANSWKIIKNFEYRDVLCDLYGKHVNGKLHWGSMVGVSDKFKIVSFDLGSEKQGIIELPINIEGRFHPVLGVLGECLCLLCYYRETCMDVWVMKEYGPKESWSKVINVPSVYNTWSDPYRSAMPLCITEECGILFYEFPYLIFYDPKTNSFSYREICNSSLIPEVDVYVQSLVSPYPV